MPDNDAPLYGLLAEFNEPEPLLSAAEKAYEAGYRKMDAYSPFPIDGLGEALGLKHTWVSEIVLAAGILGGVGGYLLQVWACVWSYPINVGGRPLNSWPSFIPVTFELTILCAALAAFLSVLVLNGFPEPYHPVFNVQRFLTASQTQFFLCIETRDPKFDPTATREFLKGLGAKAIYDVES